MTASRAASAPPVPGERRRRWLPFWLLQAAELVVAFVFVDLSVHVDHGDLLVAAAAVFALLAVTAQGPLGLVRVCPLRLHLVLVIAACVLVAVASVIPGFRPDIEGIIIAIFGCIGLVRLATLTRTEPAGSSSRTRPGFTAGSNPAGPGSPVIDASASVVHHRPEGPGTRSDAGPETPVGGHRPPGGPAATAHHVGRLAATAAETAKRTASRNGPAARAYTKQSLRNAGRAVGRWTSGDHQSSAANESTSEREEP